MVRSHRNRGPWKDIDANVTIGEKSYFDTNMWIFKYEIDYGGASDTLSYADTIPKSRVCKLLVFNKKWCKVTFYKLRLQWHLKQRI